MFSIKCKIRHFNIIEVQKRQTSVQKSVMLECKVIVLLNLVLLINSIVFFYVFVAVVLLDLEDPII